MLIEKMLKNEIRKEAKSKIVPKHVDIHINNLYASHHNLNNKIPFFKRFISIKPLYQLSIILLCLALFTGFAYGTKELIYSMSTKHFQIDIMQDPDLILNNTTKQELREISASVRNQLEENETAVIYIEALSKEKHPFFRNNPGVVVSNPKKHHDFADFSQIIKDQNLYYKFPSWLPNGFSFKEGLLDHYIDGAMNENGMELLQQLKKNAKRNGEAISWAKIESMSNPLETYTLIYENTSQEQIFITVSSIDKSVIKMELSTPLSEFETLRINGHEGYYTENSHFFYNENEYLQEISWTEIVDDAVMLYGVGTASSTLSKEVLTQIAKRLK